MKKQKHREEKLQVFLLSALCASLTISACTEEAHSKTTAARNEAVVVAIIDTGIDSTHKMIANQLWQNPGETGIDSMGRDKASNGIDDDNNGYIDDVNGWNFVDNNNNLQDSHGHGTHIAGLVLGVSTNIQKSRMPNSQANLTANLPDNSQSTSSKIRIMSLKYFDPTSTANNIAASNAAIRYAIKMKAQIINYSGGGLEPSYNEFQALKEAEAAGIVLVAAAGNEGKNISKIGFYPAHYKLNNIVSVAACDQNHKLLPSSNYGQGISLIEFGKDIESTLPKGRFGKMTGTSQATAIVTHRLANLKAQHPETEISWLSQQMIQTAGNQTLQRLASKPN